MKKRMICDAPAGGCGMGPRRVVEVEVNASGGASCDCGSEMKPARGRVPLAEIDLTPLAVTEIDLLGTSVPETFAPFGVTHRSKVADWTPELGKILTDARTLAEKSVNGATKIEMIAFLASRGIDADPEYKRSSLCTRCMIAINDALSPARFVNAAPNEWICGCGYVGPATYRKVTKSVHVPVCGGEGCTRPHYFMQLTAARAWVQRVFTKTEEANAEQG